MKKKNTKNTKIIAGIAIGICVLAIAALIYAVVTLHIQKKEQEKHLIEISFTELQEKLDNKETFILVLTQSTCSHCAEYKPILKPVLAKYDIYAYELQDDKLTSEEKQKFKQIADTSGTPTTIFFIDGEEKETSNRIIGSTTESKLINRLKAMGYIKE